jgi:hypothetical protein
MTQSKRPARRATAKRRRTRRAPAAPIEVKQIESLRAELQRLGGSSRVPAGARSAKAPRWNANPDDVRRSVVKLVLTLVEFIRQLLERQALRRMEAGTLSDGETEAVGLALMRLEETIRDLGAQFDLAPEDLNLDLGPVGRLL